MSVADETRRLRRARQLFERAQAEGVDMGEARRRIHRERWEEINARLARKAAERLCGTQAPAIVVTPEEDGVDRRQWWQRD